MAVVPFIVEETGRGERSYDIFSRLLKDRIIFLTGEINGQIADLIVAELLFSILMSSLFANILL